MAHASLSQVLGLDEREFPDIARYEVLGVLGEGAQGRVLLGRDRKLKRELAIKISIDALTPSQIMRFHREARALAALRHPNILSIVDYSGETCPRPYIVSERLTGVDLEGIVNEAPLDELAVIAIGHDIAGALACAHAAQIIHRDVKPANIVIEPDGRIVLIDFGMVKGIREEDADGRTLVDSQTKLVGTPVFSSPDQLSGAGRVTAQSDLFSLGATLYTLVSQVLPFRGDTIVEIVHALKYDAHLPLDRLVELSAELSALIDHLLQKAPNQRPASAAEVQQRLARMLAARGAVSTMEPLKRFAAQRAGSPRITDRMEIPESVEVTRVVAPTARTQTQEHPRSPRKAWPFVAAALVLLAGGAFVLSQRKPPPPPPPVAIEPPPAPPAIAQGNASIRVAVKPWGRVSMDGELKGVTPRLRVIEAPLGKHLLDIECPGYRTLTREVTLETAGGEVLVQVELEKN